MRLVLKLREAMNIAHVGSAAQLEEQLGLSSFREKVPDLLANRFQRISRRELHALLTWAERHKFTLTDFGLHPLWQTIPGAATTIFFDDTFNARHVLGKMTAAIEDRRGQRPRLRQRPGEQDIEELMKTENCIFLGGPVRTPKSEAAYALLCGAQPFDDSPRNVARLPIRFVGTWTPPPSRSAWALHTDNVADACLRVQIRNRKVSLPVTRYPDSAEFARDKHTGLDAGVLVAARRPLGTDCDVTTIILAGMSSAATEALVDEMIGETADMIDETLPMPRDKFDDTLPSGGVLTRLLRLPFTVDGQTYEKKLSPRGRGWFSPDTSARDWMKIERARRDDE